MRVVILDDAAAVAGFGADRIVDTVRRKPSSVLGLATGSTPVALYEELIRRHRRGDVSFSEVVTFNLDEYFGIDPEHPQSYRQFMTRHLFGHVDIDPRNTHVPDGLDPDHLSVSAAYETAIAAAGGIDLQLLGIGQNGHIGFNEPSSSLGSRTRIKTLTARTLTDNARFFAAEGFQPQLAITMGIATILDAREILLLATGDNKAEAIASTVQGPVTANCPASALQMHSNVCVAVDTAAASQLDNPDFFRHIEQQNQAHYPR